MNVKFTENNQYFEITESKEYNYNEEYAKRHLNRVLAKMEYYFRENDLLFPGEMLDITDTPQKHIRLPFIQHIAYRRGWLRHDEYVNLITK